MALFLVLVSFVYADEAIVVIDDFENGLSRGWNEQLFRGRGRTEYKVVKDGGGNVLEARSLSSASGLFFNRSFSLEDFPVISWRWKIDKVIAKGDARKKEGDDFAARIYVVFYNPIPFLSRSINYVWANSLPKGESAPNTYFSRSILVAVESGNREAGKWVAEERNIMDDYKRFFGEEPAEASAIALMSDSDDTGGETVAWFDDIFLHAKR